MDKILSNPVLYIKPAIVDTKVYLYCIQLTQKIRIYTENLKNYSTAMLSYRNSVAEKNNN